MNDNRHNLYSFIGRHSQPPLHPVLDLNGYNPAYGYPHHLQTVPLAVHPGTGILPISEIPVFTGFDLAYETDLSTPTGSRPNKPRRRRTADGDVIKHRRTRNGCYTCRGRRIKCDEGRPICERCKKGSRDCVYPDAPAPKSKSKSPKESVGSPKSPDSPHSLDDEDMQLDENNTLNEVAYETEGSQTVKQESPSSNASQWVRTGKMHSDQLETSLDFEEGISEMQRKHRTKTPSTKKVNFESESTLHASPESFHETATYTENPSDGGSVAGSPVIPGERHAYSHLRPELRDLMRYHHAHIGFHHYFFRQDATQFVKDLLPTAALGYEPLLYAVCAFAAYHRAIAQDGHIEDFLGYSQKAVTLLLKSLKSGQEHTEATLMTMLELAALEEYLGDWVNLVGHLNAAREILHELHTPITIVATEVSRKIFSWYARFDIFASMAAGYQSSLTMDWHQASERWHYQARSMDPSSVDLQIRWLVSYKRLLTYALTKLSSKAVAGEIGKDDFAKQYADLMEQVAAWGTHLVPLTTGEDVEKEPLPVHLGGKREKDQEDADSDSDAEDEIKKVSSTDTRAAKWPEGFIRAEYHYKGSAWGVNLMVIDMYSTSALQRINYARIMGLPEVAREAETIIKEECRLIEALTTSDSAPEGGILLAQSQLALLSMFFRDQPDYISWCRRKLAKLEDFGYSFPPLMRARIADTWGDPSIRDWWLPDGEGHRPIIKALRAFNREREATPRDRQGEDVRNMRGLFSQMKIDARAGDAIIAGLGSMETGQIGGKTGEDVGGHGAVDPSLKDDG